jgi:heme A synthase
MTIAVATDRDISKQRSSAVRAVTALPWVHYWAVLTVCATLCLLAVGSAVTTFRAGMADPVWPTSPLALAQSSSEQLDDLRFVIEHSHRLAGYAVGVCAIVLCGGLWLTERRRWLCWLGTLALAEVVIQGIFGGLRVTEHARWGLELRIVHGWFAQLVLAMFVSIAVFTWPGWSRASATASSSPSVQQWSLLAMCLLYMQIVFGVVLRHTYHPLGQRLHLLTAFAATAAVIWLLHSVLRNRAHDRAMRMFTVLLGCLVALQLVLGVEAWLVQFGSGTLPDMLPATTRRVLVRTGHFFVGSLVFAASVVTFLLARRPMSAYRAEGLA